MGFVLVFTMAYSGKMYTISLFYSEIQDSFGKYMCSCS